MNGRVGQGLPGSTNEIMDITFCIRGYLGTLGKTQTKSAASGGSTKFGHAPWMACSHILTILTDDVTTILRSVERRRDRFKW
jgi:hypothetical protein